jgi:hypothetical protein
MANGDELKPDVSIISKQRFESQVGPIILGSKHQIMRGSLEPCPRTIMLYNLLGI